MKKSRLLPLLGIGTTAVSACSICDGIRIRSTLEKQNRDYISQTKDRREKALSAAQSLSQDELDAEVEKFWEKEIGDLVESAQQIQTQTEKTIKDLGQSIDDTSGSVQYVEYNIRQITGQTED